LKIWKETAQSEAIQQLKGRTIAETEENDEPEPPPDSYDYVYSDSGWLSPEGKFYPCGYMEHVSLLGSLDLTQGAAEKAGWVKFGGGSIYGFLWDHQAKPTEIQKKLTRDWCLTTHTELPSWAEE
jgi:hypothetical protein